MSSRFNSLTIKELQDMLIKLGFNVKNLRHLNRTELKKLLYDHFSSQPLSSFSSTSFFPAEFLTLKIDDPVQYKIIDNIDIKENITFTDLRNIARNYFSHVMYGALCFAIEGIDQIYLLDLNDHYIVNHMPEDNDLLCTRIQQEFEKIRNKIQIDNNNYKLSVYTSEESWFLSNEMYKEWIKQIGLPITTSLYHNEKYIFNLHTKLWKIKPKKSEEKENGKKKTKKRKHINVSVAQQIVEYLTVALRQSKSTKAVLNRFLKQLQLIYSSDKCIEGYKHFDSNLEKLTNNFKEDKAIITFLEQIQDLKEENPIITTEECSEIQKEINGNTIPKLLNSKF